MGFDYYDDLKAKITVFKNLLNEKVASLEDHVKPVMTAFFAP